MKGIRWLTLAGVAFGPLAAAGEPATSVEALYDQHCLACHGAALQGSAHGPPLKGEHFLNRWGGSRQALLTYNLATMPPGGSSLSASEQAALVDFLFAGTETGHRGLEAGDEASVTDSWSGVAGIDEMARSRSAFRNRAIEACPGIYGGHNWQAMAYSAVTNRLVIPLHRLCSDLTGRAVPQVAGEGGFGGNSRSYPMPGSDGLLGMLVAVDADRMQPAWTHTQRAMFMTGALATVGGLVFIGDLDRYFKAFDAETGQVLWQTRLGAPTHGYPITYMADGAQFVAVPTGMGVFRAMTAVISPDIHQPAGGQALYVFKLPPSGGR